MWINETLSKNNFTEDAHVGVVTDVVNGLITVNSHTQIANVQVLNSFGICSMPCIGQEVLVLPTKSGEYICIGDASLNSSLSENETVISSQGGGYIKLKADSSVVINGLTITKDGKLIHPVT